MIPPFYSKRKKGLIFNYVILQYVTRHSRKSLRVLGSAGEPINPSAWRFTSFLLCRLMCTYNSLIIISAYTFRRWFYNVVGDSRCPISDTWWQTETGGFMVTYFHIFFHDFAYCNIEISDGCVFLLGVASLVKTICSALINPCFLFYLPDNFNIPGLYVLCCRLLLYLVHGHRSLALPRFHSLGSRYSDTLLLL